MSNRYIAPRLVEKYKLKVKHSRYHQDGKWYHPLEHFPAAYLDKQGYIIFKTEAEYQSNQHLSIGKDVNIQSGISSIPGYMTFIKRGNTLAKRRTARGSTSTKPNTRKTSAPKPKPYYNEGGIKERHQEMIHRDSQLRTDAIAKKGVNCSICGFNFEKVYGTLGEGFIEVHHLVPLSTFRSKIKSTLDDVIVVCSNCHSMLHRRGAQPISPRALKSRVRKSNG